MVDKKTKQNSTNSVFRFLWKLEFGAGNAVYVPITSRKCKMDPSFVALRTGTNLMTQKTDKVDTEAMLQYQLFLKLMVTKSFVPLVDL